jgi:hypothetical protein
MEAAFCYRETHRFHPILRSAFALHIILSFQGIIMTGEKKIVGLWSHTASTDPVTDAPLLLEDDMAASEDAPAPRTAKPAPIPMSSALVTTTLISEAAEPKKLSQWPIATVSALSLGWSSFVLWAGTEAFTRAPAIEAWPNLASAVAAPIAVALLVTQWVMRSGTREQQRYSTLAQTLQHENAALASSLENLHDHLDRARRQLNEQAQHLQKLGLDTVIRLDENSEKLAARAETVAAATQSLAQQADRALQQMDGLLSGLPRVDDVAQRLTTNFREAGLTAHQQGGQLEAHLASLADQSARATAQAETATKQLNEALETLTHLSADTARGLTSASEKVAETQAAALTAMSRGTSAVQKDMEATSAKITADMEHLWQAFRHEVDTASEHLMLSMRNAQDANAELATGLKSRGDESDDIAERLRLIVSTTQSQLADLDQAFDASNHRICETIDSSKAKLQAFAADIGNGNRSAQQLISHSDALLIALDSVTRELDETLPLAFQRLEAHEQSAQQAVSRLKPMIEASELVAQSTLSQIQAAEKTLNANDAQLSAHAAQQEKMIDALQDAMQSSQSALSELQNAASAFAEHSGQDMLATIDSVRTAAHDVAADAKAAFATLSAQSRSELHDHAAKAVDEAFRAEMVGQLEAIELASHRAVAAANSAAERLSRQVTAILDASETIEARTTEAEQAIAAVDRDTLAKQVGLLTEALKSTAIDMTKILSSEVSDTAWEAYLRGDRGIFARRAVRLLDHGDAREILRLYQNDNSFHASVNQFIHDFEAMLRLLMNARDGSSISVTLLSSDIGKLYVALAQSIDRLRN